jgi:hypothetical protein
MVVNTDSELGFRAIDLFCLVIEDKIVGLPERLQRKIVKISHGEEREVYTIYHINEYYPNLNYVGLPDGKLTLGRSTPDPETARFKPIEGLIPVPCRSLSDMYGDAVDRGYRQNKGTFIEHIYPSVREDFLKQLTNEVQTI